MSANQLQAAVVERLATTAAVTDITGPDRLFDQRITRVEPPYLVIGDATQTDWSTSDDPGSEHRFVIEAWTRQNGRKQAVALADAVRAALHDANLTMDGVLLINLRHERTLSGRARNSGLHVARLRFRAVTEP